MPYNNLTVAKQIKDAESHWVEEGELIPGTDIAFTGVNLEGKTLDIFLPITEQLLESFSNLEKQAEYQNINKLEYDNKNYDLLIQGSREIKKANLNTTHSALNVGFPLPSGVTTVDIKITKSADGFYIEPPKEISQLIQNESNNLKDREGIVYDKDHLLLGIHKHVTIEWGYVKDQFQRIIKGLRIVMRCDLALLNEKAVTHIKPKTITKLRNKAKETI